MSSKIVTYLESLWERFSTKTVALKLRHIRADGSFQAVDEFALEVDCHGLAGRIHSRAQDDADMLSGTQTYGIYPYEGSESVGSRGLFRVDGQTGPDAGLSEPASAQGLLAQTMRHLEATQRMLLTGMASMNSAKDREMARITARMTDLELRDQLRAFEHEKTLKLRAERENLVKDADHKRALVREGFDFAKTFLPMALSAANDARDKDGKPKQTPLDSIAFRSFLESLRSEQLEKLADILDPAQVLFVANSIKDVGTKPINSEQFQGLLESLRPEQLNKMSEVLDSGQLLFVMTIHRRMTAKPEKTSNG